MGIFGKLEGKLASVKARQRLRVAGMALLACALVAVSASAFLTAPRERAAAGVTDVGKSEVYASGTLTVRILYPNGTQYASTTLKAQWQSKPSSWSNATGKSNTVTLTSGSTGILSVPASAKTANTFTDYTVSPAAKVTNTTSTYQYLVFEASVKVPKGYHVGSVANNVPFWAGMSNRGQSANKNTEETMRSMTMAVNTAAFPLKTNEKKKYTGTIVDVKLASDRYAFTIDPNGGTMPDNATLGSGWTGGGGTTAATRADGLGYGTGDYWANEGRIPTRAGYTFAGFWTAKTSSGGEQVFDSAGNALAGTYWTASGSTAAYKAVEDLTVYARWTPTPYAISYSLGGGTNAAANPASYTVETSTFTLSEPSRYGYTFEGWTGSNGTAKQKSVTVAKGTTGELSYTANWSAASYAISYSLGGGTNAPANPTSGTYSDTAWTASAGRLTVNAPTRTGYTFSGWTISGMDTGTVAGSTATHYYGYGTTYSFQGTSTTAATLSPPTSYIYFKNLRVSSGTVTFTANWTANSYTISYNLNGTSAYPAQNASGNPTSASYDGGGWSATGRVTVNAPTRTGYTFAGWAISGMDSGVTHYYGYGTGTYQYSTTTLASLEPATSYIYFKNLRSTSGTVTFSAKWTPVSYAISYNLNGTSAYPAQNGSGNPASYSGDTAPVTLAQPTRNGYSFDGWTGSNGTAKSASVTIAAGSTGARSYTANWSVATYSVSYSLAGGSLPAGASNPSGYTINTGAVRLTAPQRTGWTFAGWTGTGLAGATADVTIPAGAYGNRSYTATWTRNSYSLEVSPSWTGDGEEAARPWGTFDVYVNGSRVADDVESYSGDVGYNLSWRVSDVRAAFGRKYTGVVSGATGGTMGTSGAKTVLGFDTNAKGISYDLAGGSHGALHPASYVVGYGAEVSDPVREGYDFEGWTVRQVAADGQATTARGVKGLSIGADADADYELAATWRAHSYSVRYLGNGGTAPSSPSGCTPQGEASYVQDGFSYGTPKELAACAFSREHYEFEGWNTKADGSGDGFQPGRTVEALCADDGGVVELHARWKPVSWRVSYDLAGGTAAGNPASYTVEDSFELAPPAKIGYEFAGWTGSCGDEPQTAWTVEAGTSGELSFTATWKVVPTFVNEQDSRGGAQFSKASAETGEPLSGARIRVYRAADEAGARALPAALAAAGWPDPDDSALEDMGYEAVAAVTTGADGTARTADTALGAGWHAAAETSAPPGYTLPDEPAAFAFEVSGWAVTAGADADGAPMAFSNEPDRSEERGGARLAKADAQSGSPLAGAGFSVYAADAAFRSALAAYDAAEPSSRGDLASWLDDAGVEPAVGRTLYTGADGIAATSDRELAVGGYAAVERVAPDGYALAAGWRAEFSVAADGEVADLTGDPCADEPKEGSYRIAVSKRYVGGELSGGEFAFELYAGDAPAGEPIATAENDAEGNVEFPTTFHAGAADAGTTRSYTVVERDGGQRWVRYDGRELRVDVRVSDEGGSELSCETSFAYGDDTFYNYKIEPYAAVPLTGGAFAAAAAALLGLALSALSARALRRRGGEDGDSEAM